MYFEWGSVHYLRVTGHNIESSLVRRTPRECQDLKRRGRDVRSCFQDLKRRRRDVRSCFQDLKRRRRDAPKARAKKENGRAEGAAGGWFRG